MLGTTSQATQLEDSGTGISTTFSCHTKITVSDVSIHSFILTTSQLKLLEILHSNPDSLIHTLDLCTLAQTRRALSTSLSTNHTSDLARPLDGISALATSILTDVAAVDDFALGARISSEEVDRLVLVRSFLWIRDCLDGFGDGFGVGGHVLDVDDCGGSGGIFGEVVGDRVEDFLVLGFQKGFLVG